MTDTTEPGFVDVRENAAREAAREIAIRPGGAVLTDWAQQVDYAKYMAQSRISIPKHLRGNIGDCLAVIDMASRWGFSPYQVARQTYFVNDILAFESQLIHAIVEKFAPLKMRLRVKYTGEGDKRQAVVTGHFKGELEPVEYTTPELGKITPKNSPLWKSDPDQQLFYFATQRWARRYCPDVLFGIHDVDQMTDAPPVGFERAKDITPLAERLRNAKTGTEGFVGENVIAAIDADLAAVGAEF